MQPGSQKSGAVICDPSQFLHLAFLLLALPHMGCTSTVRWEIMCSQELGYSASEGLWEMGGGQQEAVLAGGLAWGGH